MSSMNAKFKCRRCAQCCKTYWITLLPSEASAIAKLLGLSLKQFLKKHCVIFLQAFPSNASASNPLVKGAGLLPAKLRKRLLKKASAGNFLLLPGIALKRSGKNCAMLSERLECRIHSKRPGQCRLFPLIGMDEKTDLKRAYAFCKGLKGFEKISLKDNRKHYAKVKAYFELVKKKGFRKAWKEWPSKGMLLLDREEVCAISEKEFFQSLGF